jgi:hypothetical protein
MLPPLSMCDNKKEEKKKKKHACMTMGTTFDNNK